MSIQTSFRYNATARDRVKQRFRITCSINSCIRRGYLPFVHSCTLSTNSPPDTNRAINTRPKTIERKPTPPGNTRRIPRSPLKRVEAGEIYLEKGRMKRRKTSQDKLAHQRPIVRWHGPESPCIDLEWADTKLISMSVHVTVLLRCSSHSSVFIGTTFT